ncbi:hypothetical protein BH10PSE15_BH10PSE15_18890 [soil metagenome]
MVGFFAPGQESMFARLVKKLMRDHRGGTAIEYGLIAALVIITMVLTIVELGGVTSGMWNTVNNKVANVTPGQ